jgi:hypothetical protein
MLNTLGWKAQSTLQVYRWHSTISQKQEKWTENLYKELFGKEPEEVSLPELLKGLSMWEKSLDKDPQKRPFAHLKRGSDGKFDDSDLVNILTEAIEDPAGKVIWRAPRRSLNNTS